MRVLAYSHNFYPTVGGIASYCNTLFRGLSARGIELTALLPIDSETAKERNLPYPIIEMDMELSHDRIHLFSYRKAITNLQRAIETNRPDVLWCCNLDAIYVAALNRIPCATVLTVHGSEITKNFNKKGIQHRVRAKLIQKSLDRADRIIAVSRYTKKRIVAHSPANSARTDVIYNGITPQTVQSETNKRPTPSHLLRGNSKTGRLLLSAGRLVEFKGFHLFPPILANIVRHIPDIHWLLAGEGPFKAQIEEQVSQLGLQDHVTFAGWVDQERLGYLYSKAELLVHPAIKDKEGREESFGLILVEAMMNGCPVATTGSGGTGEVIGDGEYGILFDPYDTFSSAELLTRYLLNPKLLQKLSNISQGTSRKLFSTERWISDTHRSLEKGLAIAE